MSQQDKPREIKSSEIYSDAEKGMILSKKTLHVLSVTQISFHRSNAALLRHDSLPEQTAQCCRSSERCFLFVCFPVIVIFSVVITPKTAFLLGEAEAARSRSRPADGSPIASWVGIWQGRSGVPFPQSAATCCCLRCFLRGCAQAARLCWPSQSWHRRR